MKKKMNNSAAKKLVPAAGMLGVSAMMLATSTYAWFTMSKEVEVTGINLTATVPENIQISLGNNQATGTLQATFDDTSKRLTSVALPGEDDSDEDWSNSVVVADYYKFGKLTPATSYNGLDIFYTSDANGVGKTLKGQVVKGSTVSGSVDNSQFKTAAGLTASACAASDTPSDKYDLDGAYYIDIPVWFRSSAQGTVTLAALATISNQSDASVGFNANTAGSRSNSEDDDLYKAVRVSILKGEGTTAGGTANVNQGVLTSESYGDYYSKLASNNRPMQGGAATISTIGESAAWSAVVFATPYSTKNTDGYATNGTDLITITNPGTAGKNFSPSQRYTIRVWIEGEDVNCWNATAGQNFTVSLNFVRHASDATKTEIAAATGVTANTIAALPATTPVDITLASAPDGRATLKLMKSSNGAATPTYTWSVANNNAFYLATGESLTVGTVETKYTTLDALIAALNTSNSDGTTPTITYVAPTT